MPWSWVFCQVGPRLRKPGSAQILQERWPLTLLTSLWEAREGHGHSACGEDARNLGLNTGGNRHLDDVPVAHTPVFIPMDASLTFVSTKNNKLNVHRSLRGARTRGLLALRGPCPVGEPGPSRQRRIVKDDGEARRQLRWAPDMRAASGPCGLGPATGASGSRGPHVRPAEGPCRRVTLREDAASTETGDLPRSGRKLMRPALDHARLRPDPPAPCH